MSLKFRYDITKPEHPVVFFFFRWQRIAGDREVDREASLPARSKRIRVRQVVPQVKTNALLHSKLMF